MSEARKSFYFYIGRKAKILSVFFAVFFITTLNLCADGMTAAQARVCRENLIAEAKKYIGCKYLLGSEGPYTFDCSGLVRYVANQANNTKLPHSAEQQYAQIKIVPNSQKEPGDLLFFKTDSSGRISHVGIYIGNNEFISALSEGKNKGVSISSLDSPYWNKAYAGVGQLYKSGKINDSNDNFTEEPFNDSNSGKAKRTVASAKSNNIDKKDNSSKVTDNIIFDGSIYMSWSLFKPDSFMINFRGTEIQSSVRYDGFILSPGVGFSLRYNAAFGVLQLPLLFSLTPTDFLKFYAGPIFTFGSPAMKWTKEPIKPSVFPGIIGVSFSTPSFTKGDLKVQIVQDVSYSICNTKDGAALNFVDSITTGLVFFTGIKITMPLSTFTKN